MGNYRGCRNSTERTQRRLFRALSTAGLLLCAATVLGQEEVLFDAEFSGHEPGSSGASVWTSISGPSDGEVEVAVDGANRFGEGTDFRYLRFQDANQLTFAGELSEPTEVVTMRLVMIGRNTANDNRWVQFNMLAGDGNDRAHIHSLALSSRIIRGANVSYGGNNVLLQFAVVMNNRKSAVLYEAPDGSGEEYRLGAGSAAVWLNGDLLIASHVFGRVAAGTGPIRAISIQADSTAVVSFDLGRLTVTRTNATEVTPPMVSPGADGRLEYTTDERGNRIPDFSNSGYMGGGVPIPDVPVKVVLYPEDGDDRARIQAAIDQVGNLPLDFNGFRGAVLLKAGEYQVSSGLTISKSGVVLRGEGDGADGTIIRATGTHQYSVVTVSGTGSWSEVAGTRRSITDDYVPVGAESFTVTDASGFSVGDTIIVHRPSTAAWISAIGMDQIPPRSDGAPVTQWQPGAYDIRFDRVITAIDGNTITIDAPLTNALESEYGGGSVYRYTFSGRISQVGIEDIRGVSSYAGGAWNTSQFDENHAWTFIQMDRVQNAWVRRTTALHFGFGNTDIRTYGKWITVEDSQNLQPVSTIAGSRRYPFYVQGQMNLVQRCYANYARHDFGTNARTVGPNVFLDCRGDHSYADTGPHHRWSTGTLYDNIEIPDNTIAIQNRLNYGSGHGWAGANHVVWNSSADRLVVQNPPTAQNWAIGVTGTKWQGAFPAYAEDGYWISHNVPVDPASLYLKQLEDRLDPVGSGGEITVVRFESATTAELEPGGWAQFSISRVGNRDGLINVQFVVEGDGAELLAVPEFVSIPANSSGANLLVQYPNGRPLPDTPREVTIRLVHGTAYSVGDSTIAAIHIPASPFGAWRAEHFSAEQLEDPLISGPDATPAGDGIENLLKYALNLNPFEPAQRDDLPLAQLVNGRLALTYSRSDLRSDISCVAEVSDDLVSWTSGDAVTETIAVEVDGDWERVTIADRLPVSESGCRFMRLRVEWKE